MELFEAVEKRRSIKHFDSSAAMPEEDFQRLMSSVILSPTSFNIQNWRFVRITDKNLREQLKAVSMNQNQVTDAAELLVLCADLNAWHDRTERYWVNADDDTRAILLPMIESFYTGKELLQRDEAIRSCSIAAQTLMLGAKAMGYDTCALIGFDPDKVAELIKLPDHHIIALLVAVGKAAKPANPRGGQLPLNEVLLENTF